MASSIDWTVDNTEGLVSIGTHSLYLRAAGPVRSPGTPAVIGIAGLGDSSVTWTAVQRHVSAFARCYIYDRTGLGNSEIPSDFTVSSQTYVNIAKELKLLLDTAKILPPYILAMHSMAGIPGREFLNLYPTAIAGMVFLDTVTEENYKTRPKELPEVMRSLSSEIDTSFLWTERKPAMTESEWLAVANAEGMGPSPPPPDVVSRQRQSGRFEMENLIPSSNHLASLSQLTTLPAPMGNTPVSVVKADGIDEFRRCYNLAVSSGKGTPEERKLISDYLETADEKQLLLQFRQLRLSSNSRLVEARHSWHNVQVYQPELVAREVRWCLEEFGKLPKE